MSLPEGASEPPESPFAALPVPLAAALTERGFTDLTEVQEAVLDPVLSGRDLRIVSRTGSGKTLAFAFAMAEAVTAATPAPRGSAARPVALVLAPTRELAEQVRRELEWSLGSLGARVAAVIGGTAYRSELRGLATDPAVIVGTPGRLLDHLDRGAIDPSRIGVLVLDEADQMLDLGFREALEAISARLPTERRTHLVSATFPAPVLHLCDAIQRDPALVEGATVGGAHPDIEHQIVVVRPGDRFAVLVNLLLLEPDEHTLVFVRTRAGTAELHGDLVAEGFVAAMLSGEMDQGERSRTLQAFRSAQLSVLVATDVAARGIDVAGIGRVVHFDPAVSAEGYTHRSGRTGRAGQKGRSITLVPPAEARRFAARLGRIGMVPRFVDPPTAETVRRAEDARFQAALLAPEAAPPEAARELARRLLAAVEPEELVARLLARYRAGRTAPREVAPLPRAPEGRGPHGPGRVAGAPRRFVPFRVTWGASAGADARRLLALVCRRGGVRGTDVGAIRVGPRESMVEIDEGRAGDFAAQAGRADPRDPEVRIEPLAPHRAGPRPRFPGGPPAHRGPPPHRAGGGPPRMGPRGRR